MRVWDEAERRAMLGILPPNADVLHTWVRELLGFDVPRIALAEGSSAPFEYLKHAFFEESQGPRDCVVWASRGGGKTQLGAIATLLDMVHKPGIQVRILGGSLEQSCRMHEHLRRMLERPPLADLVRGAMTQRHIRLRNGSAVEVLSQSERSVRGTRVQKIRCDELDLFDEQVWEAAQLTTRSMRCGEVEVRSAVEAFSTMHEPHGLMQRIVRQAQADGRRKILRWGMIDTLEHCGTERTCPGCGLWEDCGGRAKGVSARGFVRIDDMLVQRTRVGAAMWSAEMLCREPYRGNAVYPEFAAAMHVFDDDDDAFDAAAIGRGMWLGGLDFGYRNKSALLWAWRDERDVLHVVDELVAERTIVEQVIEAAAQRESKCGWRRPAWIGADPAGNAVNEQTGRSTVALWRKAGWPVRTRSSAVLAGVNLVRARLQRADGTVGLRIHRRCAQLIEAMTMYRWPHGRPGAVNPVKDGSDHVCDALRYLVVNLDGSTLEAVTVRGY